MNLFWLHTRLLIVAIIWGLGWTAGRVVATDFPPITAAWIRYIIAVAMFLVWLKMTGKFRIPTKEEWKLLFYIGFFSTFLYQAFFMYGMRYTAAGDASLMDGQTTHHWFGTMTLRTKSSWLCVLSPIQRSISWSTFFHWTTSIPFDCRNGCTSRPTSIQSTLEKRAKH